MAMKFKKILTTLMLLTCSNLCAAPNTVSLDDYALVDLGGLGRFTVGKDLDRVPPLEKAQHVQQVIGDNLQLLRSIGYDQEQNPGFKPVLALRPTVTGLPTLYFNGTPLFTVTYATAQLYGMNPIELANHWLRDMKTLLARLSYMTPEQVLVLRPEAVLADLAKDDHPAEVTVGGVVVMRLRHASERLISGQQRATLAFDVLQDELMTAINSKNYDGKRIQVGKKMDNLVITAGGQTVCVVTDEDAQFNHSTPFDLAKRWAENIRQGILQNIPSTKQV